MKNKVVAVLTASSTSGRSCVSRLLMAEQETSIRACFRSEEKRDAVVPALLEESGWSSATADASALESAVGVDAGDVASLKEALSGADAAVLVTPLDYSRGFELDAAYSVNMCRAAIECNVSRVVHVGSWTTVASKELPGLANRFLATEEYLKGSAEVPPDLEWCVLRGGYFLSNLAHMFGESLRGGGTSLAFPSVTMPPVDTRDIGEVAAELCLLDSGSSFAPFQGRFLQCSGRSVASFSSLTQELSDALSQDASTSSSSSGGGGSAPSHEPMDVVAWCEGKPPPLQELLRFMVDRQAAAVPFEEADVADMERLLRRPLRGVADWARDHKHLLTPPPPPMEK